ncbi:choice-of-anchor K domain-containing protein [Telluria beijingensis]|uniref:choice-of-anchor K domain-containing protein n=1 Tax=Telluria beijingensis TaxID=3068633 RepID=UPI0027959D84|nr:choice-of-anchor K domain-containing protein [Massilia sp. REN29]
MLNFRSTISAVILAVPMIFAAGAASAAPMVTGSSSGNFSDMSCGALGGCATNDTVNGNDSQMEWGGWTGIGSTLTAIRRTWDFPAPAGGVVLAELAWSNKSTSAFTTPALFSALYNLTIDFSRPTDVDDTEQFNLAVLNIFNNTGDTLFGLQLTDLANLSFNLGDVGISNLRYQLASGPGTFENSIWYNPENQISTLYIVADFTDNSVAQVPEPGSLALVGLGLLGVSMLRRRRG